MKYWAKKRLHHMHVLKLYIGGSILSSSFLEVTVTTSEVHGRERGLFTVMMEFSSAEYERTERSHWSIKSSFLVETPISCMLNSGRNDLGFIEEY